LFGFREQDDGWVEETRLDQHNDWVRDVAWAPTFSFHKDKIASCSQVIIHLSEDLK
jgi:protein transport protein SEC13